MSASTAQNQAVLKLITNSSASRSPSESQSVIASTTRQRTSNVNGTAKMSLTAYPNLNGMNITNLSMDQITNFANLSIAPYRQASNSTQHSLHSHSETPQNYKRFNSQQDYLAQIENKNEKFFENIIKGRRNEKF